jgi:tetratricopeptide (TPR) repeat protein
LESRLYLLTKQDKDFVLNYLAEMDTARQLIKTLEKSGGPDLNAEELRLSNIEKSIRKKGKAILKIFGGVTSLKKTRPAGASPEEHSWWFIDHYVAHQRVKRGKQIATLGGVAVAFVGVILILLNTVLKPDPNVIFRIEHYDKAIQFIEEQDYETALTEVEQALTVAPDDVELLVFKGVILNQLDRADEANALFEQANSLAPEPKYVLLWRARFAWQQYQAPETLELSQEAITLDPEFAEAWFLAGQAHAYLDQIPEAYEAFSKAADLAREQGNDSLYATARINQSYLLPALP